MGFELFKLFQQVELDIDTTGPMLLEVSTDMPGNAMAVRFSKQIDTAATSGKVPVNVRLYGNTKGREIKLRISGVNTCRIFGARVFAKDLGTPTPTGWSWRPVPIDITPDLFTVAKLPIDETPNEFSSAKLPIEPTPNEFSSAKLPIEPTPNEFSGLKVPLTPSDVLFDWIDVPVDAIE
jgi:hypothetical protein